MKRIIGTVVLFVLLVLTAVALARIDTSDTSAFNANRNPASNATN